MYLLLIYITAQNFRKRRIDNDVDADAVPVYLSFSDIISHCKTKNERKKYESDTIFFPAENEILV